MLMDEPTSALDLHRQIHVLDFMRRRARAKAMLVLIAKVLVIPNGRMHACGAPRDVVTAEMLREIYRVEARVEKCSMDHDHVIVDGTAH
ncbi:putative iron ABC transporter, ATP-binding protein [Rhizobium etli CFN 42]|uniref:Iron ABC transporter, ATP-binding protein n=2 Tax=Rhizobium etli TaxID=29449 RepID=Q2K7L2_RHIEC|nr:putative iron ABC transporter, ATP-binding protein [Rhizobium etli CFN 42]AGS22186.1 P-loop NTPase domain-containing protein [Rhizobium etli bv. mimosae str. Mim1]ARQ10463.1 P-loop NTPase domain-containing protein [Rhizobium etli]